MAEWARLNRLLRRGTLYATVMTVCLVVSFPVLWALLSSVKVKEEMFAFPVKVLPSSVTVQHYQLLWSTTQFFQFFVNSCVVALGTSVVSVAGAALAAYSLTRFSFPGQGHVARGILVCYMLPPILLSVPLFILFRSLGIINTRLGLMGAHVAAVLPFLIWLLWGFFRAIPREIEEAAKIDGAGRLRVLLAVFVPVALPGIVAAMVFAFIVSWAEYLFASVMVTREEVMTLPVFIALISGRDILRWDLILAATGVITIPVIAAVILFQRLLLEGFAAPLAPR